MKNKPQFMILAVLCIISGTLLLLEAYGMMKGIYKLWPIFPLILGIGLYLLFFQKGRRDTGILGIGTYLICSSILFFFLNFNSSWAILARAWPLFIGFLGVSFLTSVIWGGRRWIFIPVSLFLIFLCVVFLLAFSIDYKLWPISLILFGICLILIRRFNGKQETSNYR